MRELTVGARGRAQACGSAVWTLAVLALAATCTAPPDRLVVFAASSLEDVLGAVSSELAGAEALQEPVFNFAGSNVLARQIEAGAVADVFLCADEAWMDALEERDLLLPGTRRTVVSNRLVVVAREDASFEMREIGDLAELDMRYLALGDPEAVPAGRYARRYLESVRHADGSLWQAVRSRIAPAPDVRAALALVEADPSLVGIVYASDALSSRRVRVLYAVPLDEGPAIRYAGAVLRRAPRADRARTYLRELSGPEARAVFERYGFVSVDG